MASRPLTARERTVAARLSADPALSYSALAHELGVTRERVRQLARRLAHRFGVSGVLRGR